jgi:hypothetical protein
VIEITIDEAEIMRWANDSNGAVARELETIVFSQVERIVQNDLSVPAEFTFTGTGQFRYKGHPPERNEPPWMRTAQLWASVEHNPPTTAGGIGLHCDITVDAHNGDENYAKTLIDRGYVFVDQGDSRFEITPHPS